MVKGVLTFQLKGEGWIKFVQRIFLEEELNYKIDVNGIIHYFVDEELNNLKYLQ